MTATVSAGPIRLGFAGVGWIGLHRMRALAASGMCEIPAICDPHDEASARALSAAPGAERSADFDALLERDLDGIVIATPNALHARQAVAALERGIAVFCQKPLARTGPETDTVISAARANDRLLGVDLSYRYTTGLQRIRELARDGALGRITDVELTFHNAYGPDKPWFRDMASSGGGCVLDLGIHLVDLLYWLLGDEVAAVRARLYAAGALLPPDPDVVDDYAVILAELASGATASVRCSWFAHAGRDAEISVVLRGTSGGASWRNVGGSFHDFVAERHAGTSSAVLSEPPDDWGGRAAVAWLRALAGGGQYDPAIESLSRVASTLDAIYGRSAQ